MPTVTPKAQILQNIYFLENAHNVDITSQFIADPRLGDPLEAGEGFLQYIFDRLKVRPLVRTGQNGTYNTIGRSL